MTKKGNTVNSHHAFFALGRRERQIMEILVRRGRATAAEVRTDLADPPTNAAVRGMLRHLEKKRYVRHEWEGPRHVWVAMGNLEWVKQSVIQHLLTSVFGGSLESALAAMLGGTKRSITHDDLDRLEDLIAKARAKTEKSS